jgi:hypothetical protein
MSIWIQTNEQEEAVGALEAFARFLPRVREDPFDWRWVILSLHTALQGFMVVAIRDTAGMFPLRDDLAAKWMKAYRSGQSPPKERLDSFPNLYKKIRRKDIADFLQGNPFVPSGTQGCSVEMLNRLRNQFVHFLPASWALEATGLPQICLDCLAIVRYLVHDYRRLLWRDAAHLQRIDGARGRATAILQDLKREYETGAG